MESEKRYASASSSLTPTSSSSSSSPSPSLSDEFEAAETLAYFARLPMRRHTTHSTDNSCTNRFNLDSTIPHSDPPPPSTQNECLRNIKVEQDADLSKTDHCNKTRRDLTEEEKEARRIRRVLANRESARQTIRRRQALSEELSRKAASLVLENENLKRKKELALKEYQSLETTNKLLKAQVSKSINTKVEKTPIEQELSMAEVAPMSGNSPWFRYNHFPVRQLFWPSIFQSSNQVHTPFNSIAIPSHVYVPCSSESESPHKRDNPINDNQTQNPLYMFPCPWLYPPPDIGNGQPSASSCIEDKQDNLPLDEQCSTSLSLNRAGNGNYHDTLPINLKTEPTERTKSRSSSDPGHTTPCFSLDGIEQKKRCHNTEKFHRPAFDCNGHASVVKQEPELQLNLASNTKVSSTASGITASSLEKKQEQFICSGKNLVNAVAAAEARKRRKELTKLKSNQNRRMEC
ncbi:unnamed protein product [Vicia faba]|uniref:BZIP domain-containing protein n=1 Tax=Vicia faba TaxID=3906 RepID=A0AAV1B065_VICFA|nr:unnamed protein product [Vicia faba]